jgi:Xaa-Pro aminopeptidase
MNLAHAQVNPAIARISLLRATMQEQQLDAYLVPSSDPHLSEYLPAHWKGREWLSGFTGSVGLLIVTQDFAGLWADSRYWTQAEAELDGSGIRLMKTPVATSLLHLDWLSDNLVPGNTVGVDGAVLGLAAARLLEEKLGNRRIGLRIDCDLLEVIWPERPALPLAPVYAHVAPHAVEERGSKLALVRTTMQAQQADWHWISTLDDIAYLFNLRGSDVSYNPLFVAHALIGIERATLFVMEGKLAPELIETLRQEGVDVAPYGQAATALAALPVNATLLLDPRRVTAGLRQAVPDTLNVVEAINPSTLAKSRKTAAEINHVRVTMAHDGAALCEFFAWLEQALGQETVTELTIAEQIFAARARRPDFVSASFGTIAGFNANGAMPHYQATASSHALIEGDGLLLIDSGGQYLGGTTDITRVVAVGTPSVAQQRDVTLVLKAVIALSSTRFPQGIKAPMLDAIARAPIWAAGIEYGHGTGHGVGYFLNVHEGPQNISYHSQPEPQTAMEVGMITSIEPGIYRPGQWGVRIENLVLNQLGETTEFGQFLQFETLTLCPIDTRCIDSTLLRADEICWLNDYHATVKKRLRPYVTGAAKDWLEMRTQPI